MMRILLSFFLVVSVMLAHPLRLSAAETWEASYQTPEASVKTYFYAYAAKRFDLVYDGITERYSKMIGVAQRPKTQEGMTSTFDIPTDIQLEITEIWKVSKGAEKAGYDVLVLYDFETEGHRLHNLLAPVIEEGGAWKVTVPFPDDKTFGKVSPDTKDSQTIIETLESSGDIKFEKLR